MAKKTESEIPADKLELYDKLIATNAGLQRKGAKTPYTSLNGHMFSFLTETGTLALRLPAEARDAFLKNYRTKLCERYGTVMKEYVVVPDSLLRKTGELKKAFDASVTYIESLKPKPTTRKKKATVSTRTVSGKAGKKKAAKKKSKTTPKKKK